MSPAADTARVRWVRDPRVLWRYIGHGVLVLPVTPGAAPEPISLDAAATLVWEVLSHGGGTVDEISAAVARRAGTTEATVTSGVAHALAELDRQGAVRRDDG